MHAGRGWRRLSVHGAPLSRVSCALSANSWRAGTAFSSSGLSNACAQPAAPPPSLRIGVLGLGAIGTIFFAKLGLLATSVVHGEPQPRPALAVDAFVKPEQFRGWLEANSRDRRLAMTVHHQDPATVTPDAEAASVLRFTADRRSSKQLAVACDASDVRVRTLQREGETQTDDERLDVLLVAVKAYDSAHVLRELREKHAHLLRDDALCVLLQNGLGELPAKEEVNAQRGPAAGSHWPLLNGVTFVGGRVLSFGNVLASGLDAGTTYLAPLADSSMTSEGAADSKTVSQHQNDQDTKMKLLTQVLLAAGLRCELLEPGEMQAMLWRKLIVNAAINPLASLLDAPNKVSTI
ncbi:hypothetical protein BBJ28_00019318 [Nothophytophthora sp. Chile5]|nr:hypothetical protein BBJ28_00019318 [Nothophytophthora sp. Chile5]